MNTIKGGEIAFNRYIKNVSLMKNHLLMLSAVLTMLPLTMEAQEDSLTTHITYDLTAETAVGTGDYTAYQLATNRHHTLGTES